jgi:hypothetical protein
MDGMNLFIWRLGLKVVLEISLIRFRKCGTTFSHPMGEGMFSLARKSATSCLTRARPRKTSSRGGLHQTRLA